MGKSVGQGHAISPKLFNATLKNTFHKVKLNNNGITIDREQFTHFRFADDIKIIAEDRDTGRDLQLKKD